MLNEKKLQTQLENDIKKIETKLFKSLNDKAQGIYHIQKELDKTINDRRPDSDFDLENYKDSLWKEISTIWAKSLSKQIIATLSAELSTIVANRVTNYIKSATITIPVGQTVQVGTTGSGVTTSISPKANIK